MSDDAKPSGETPMTLEQKKALLSPSAALAFPAISIVLIWVWFVLENVVGIDFKGRKITPADPHLPLWVPLAVTPLAAIIGWFLYHRRADLIAQGVEVSGTLTKVGMISMKEMRDITFTYEVAGRTFQKSKSVSKITAADLAVGMPVRILVHPKHPSRYLLIDL